MALPSASAVCSEGDTIVEIGAHVGTETVAFNAIVGHSGRVYAIEPLYSNALEQRLRRNAIRNVTVLPYAIDETRGLRSFALPPPENTGAGK